MEHRFENLKRENKLEQTLKEIKRKELEHKQQSDAQYEQEKKKEVERKKKLEKRRQDDRRRTQEIISIVTGPVHQQQPAMILQSTQQQQQQQHQQQKIVINPIEITNDANTLNEMQSIKKQTDGFTKKIEATAFVSSEIEQMSSALSSTNNNNMQQLIEQNIPIIITTSAASATIKSRKDRNRTRSIRDKYKLPIRLPPPTIKGKFELIYNF